MSARGGRHPAGPWSRLRPVNLDPLEEIGLPSKGDNRLLDLKRQERYYTQIVERYMTFCSTAGDDLLRRLNALHISSTPQPQSQPSVPTPASLPNGSSFSIEADTDTDPNTNKDLSTLIMAMRKLREGIVASKRIDDFAKQAYIFCIRLTILAKHMESYHPALLHLLYTMHRASPLTKTELQEFAGYLVLDLACRQNDLAGAQRARVGFGVGDRKVMGILFALVHDDYELWRRVRRGVDGHQGALMTWAEQGVRVHALKCLGRAYMSVDLDFLEKVTDAKWRELVIANKVGWELQGGNVVIRRPKPR